MNEELREVVAAAARMFANGERWSSIARKSKRSVETCRQWPRRYPEIWRSGAPKMADGNRLPAHSRSPTQWPSAQPCLADQSKMAVGRLANPSEKRTDGLAIRPTALLREPVAAARQRYSDDDVMADAKRRPDIYEAAVERSRSHWRSRHGDEPAPGPILWLAMRREYERLHGFNDNPKPTNGGIQARAKAEPVNFRWSVGPTGQPHSPSMPSHKRRFLAIAPSAFLLIVGTLSFGYMLGAESRQQSMADRSAYNSPIVSLERTDMRVAHFDCFSGISGDMTLAALVDAGVDGGAIRAGLESLGLPIQIEFEKVKRNGFAATYANITAPEEETHRYLPDVEAIINKGKLSDKQRELALTIFRRLAVAEATVHGHEVEKVHFHEVGALDSIADIVGAAIALDLLGVEKFTSRSVPPGSGTVKCAHGIMPIPTPATAELLKGVPLSTAPVKAELVTPTGAAILTTVVTEFTDQPAMTIEKIGLGAGKRDFWEQPNVLRIFVGDSPNAPRATGDETDIIWVLETNLDDVSPEIIGYCTEQLFAAGALDVFTIGVQMKKNRPGVMLNVIAPGEKVAVIETILFRETGTFGIRKCQMQRTKLEREAVMVDTPWGPVKAKKGWRDGLVVLTPEYEDCARLAREKGVALREVYKAVVRSY